MNRLNVLIGMECSDIVRSAFEKRGHNAVSCDLKPCEKCEAIKQLVDDPDSHISTLNVANKED